MLAFLAATSPTPPQISAAILSVVSVILTGLVTLFGISLKNAIDRRTEARLRSESERNAIIALDSERRLKLDIAVRAVQLLSSPTGALASPIQRAGALFTLCSLEQFDLTLALLDSLLASRQIESAAAARILDEIIRKGSELQQDGAATLLNSYTDRFLAERGYDLPDSLLAGWPQGSQYVQSWVAQIIAQLLLSRSFTEWRDRNARVVTLIVALVLHWRRVEPVWIKQDAGAILAALLDVLYPRGNVLYVGADRVDLSEVKAVLQTVRAHTATAGETVKAIRQWAEPMPNNEVRPNSR